MYKKRVINSRYSFHEKGVNIIILSQYEIPVILSPPSQVAFGTSPIDFGNLEFIFEVILGLFWIKIPILVLASLSERYLKNFGTFWIKIPKLVQTS